jgi:hypothetical protein
MRRIAIVITLVVLGMLVHAQPRLKKPEIFFGVHGGAMMSSMLFNPSVTQLDLLAGPLSGNGGLVFRYAEHKVCAVQVECNYMQRGWREVLKPEGGVVAVDYRRQLDYIELPLLMHLYLGGQHVRGFFNLGPQIGYCFRDTEYGTKNPNAKHQYVPIEHPFDWGAAAGLGVYYRAKKVGLFQLEARFNYSFGSIFDNAMTDYYNYANPINLSINFAYMWQIK